MRRLIAGLLLGLATLAHAGQDCSSRKPGIEEVRRSLELAAATAEQLDALGAQVVVLARAGQDLGAYGLRYSHLGLAYRDAAALGGRGAWRVVHKLNECGTDRGTLYRQGLAEFFSDGLHRFEAGVVVLEPAVQARLLARLGDNAYNARLHEARYSMLAYPWARRYQQSNQWAIETLAMSEDAAVRDRAAAQRWLRRQGYQPSVLHIPATTRLAARIGSAHIAFDDHPLGPRLAGRIETVTVDSVFAWLAARGLGAAALRLQPGTPPRPRDAPLLPARADFATHHGKMTAGRQPGAAQDPALTGAKRFTTNSSVDTTQEIG